MAEFKSPEFLFFILFASLGILLPPILMAPGYPIWALILLELLILGVAIDLSELVAAVLVDECDLPKLGYINEYPPVAVLFLVCDDLVPLALNQLGKQTYPQADLFILDDSKDPVTRCLLDDTGFRVIRRQNRVGYKAGNLNNWLWRYGSHYKYFLVLDSDSIIPEGFIESIIRYAEHPANAQVAIFNSLPKCWNIHLRFPRLLSTLAPLHNWIRMHLSNRSPSVSSTGHNNLHRTEVIAKVGGFDENFIAEDIATTLKLIRAGYTSKIVKLVAYEAEPGHIFSYMRRTIRWAKQAVQIQRANWQDIPLSIKFQMFKLSWMYASFFVYPLWAVLAAWGASSSLTNVQTLVAAITHGDAQILYALIPFAAIMILPLILLFIRIPLLVRLDISLLDYAGSCLLSLAIGFYSMLVVCWAQIAAAAASTLDFEVTDKRYRPTTLLSILLHHWHLIPFWLLLAVGFWQNPLSFFFSVPWVLVLMLAPLIIYIFHGSRLLDEGPVNTQINLKLSVEKFL